MLNSSSVKSTHLAQGQLGVWYLGQEGMLLKSSERYLCIDPYLSYYVDENCCQFVKWERRYAPPIDADELDFLDVVLCTHSHYDHADPYTLSKIAKANPKTLFVVPAPVADTVAKYGICPENIVAAYADKKIELAGFEITPIPSAHEEFHFDENGNYCELGYIVECDGVRVFHAGDMCMYDGLCERLDNIDIAMLPINGRDYFRNKNDIIGNFTCEEAILLAKEIKADMLIPMHHDLYDVNCVDPAVFVASIGVLDPMRRFHVFAPGEKYIYSK